MRLVRRRRIVWDVLAIEDRKGESVWTWLEAEAESGNHHAQRMNDLIRHVVSNGPPKSPYMSKSLRDGIFEFLRGPKIGPKLRVLYFYDQDRMIICTHAFWKDQPTAPAEIDRAVTLKSSYFAAKKTGDIHIREERSDVQDK